MNCHDCEELLQQRLDGLAGADDPGLAEHLAECPRCRQLHQAAGRLEEGLACLPRPEPPARLGSAIVRQVLAQRRQHLRWRQRVLAAVAAVLLLILPALVYWWLPEPQVHRSARLIITPPSSQPAPSLNQRVAEAGQAVTTLGDRLADRTRANLTLLWQATTPRELPAMEPLPGMSEQEHPLEPAVQSLREATAGVGTGLQTVANSAQRAMSFFMRELQTPE
jgi:predicted anti-sigma-YlaC factor YlaD